MPSLPPAGAAPPPLLTTLPPAMEGVRLRHTGADDPLAPGNALPAVAALLVTYAGGAAGGGGSGVAAPGSGAGAPWRVGPVVTGAGGEADASMVVGPYTLAYSLVLVVFRQRYQAYTRKRAHLHRAPPAVARMRHSHARGETLLAMACSPAVNFSPYLFGRIALEVLGGLVPKQVSAASRNTALIEDARMRTEVPSPLVLVACV